MDYIYTLRILAPSVHHLFHGEGGFMLLFCWCPFQPARNLEKILCRFHHLWMESVLRIFCVETPTQSLVLIYICNSKLVSFGDVPSWVLRTCTIMYIWSL